MVILVEILKWIGVALLILLAIFFVIILLVLFVPIRYKITSDGVGNDIKANIKASWLAHAVSINYDIDLQNKREKPLLIRVFGIKVDRHKKEG